MNSNIDTFSSFYGNLFAVLVYHLEVADVGFRVVVGNAVQNVINLKCNYTEVAYNYALLCAYVQIHI